MDICHVGWDILQNYCNKCLQIEKYGNWEVGTIVMVSFVTYIRRTRGK